MPTVNKSHIPIIHLVYFNVYFNTLLGITLGPNSEMITKINIVNKYLF